MPRRAHQRAQDTTSVCVVHEGTLRTVRAEYDRESGDTLVEERPLYDVFPNSTPPYAAQADWLNAREPILFQDRAYYWNGRRVVLSPDELRAVGEFRGIPLFAEVDEAAGLSIMFVPVGRGCEFQPYYHFSGGPVRGL
ncbi:MAG TPA: hypothetical protein VEY93_14220 [Longimicrobium sp.]|nr:hypothetical protein [Longimicrobium sp.]